MDDYMREMADLKTLVTKTLEKKGVLARIRGIAERVRVLSDTFRNAELRANVFQAIEEQDREAENDGASAFALLGKCSERAKQLHATHAGKLLMGLVCEYMEWCELEHTLKVFLPELNQPRGYPRSELEEILGLKGEPKPEEADSRPLLLSIMESYIKAEKPVVAKAAQAARPTVLIKPSRLGVTGSTRPLSSSPPASSSVDHSDEEFRREARVLMSNNKLPEKPVGAGIDTSLQSRPDSAPDKPSANLSAPSARASSRALGASGDAVSNSRLPDESSKEKSVTRVQSVVADMPQHRRSTGLPAFGGLSRTGGSSVGSSIGSANDVHSGLNSPVSGGAALETGSPYTRGPRDNNGSSMSSRRKEYSWREEDELHGASFLNKKKENSWVDEELDDPYLNASRVSQTNSEKGGHVRVNQPANLHTSQSRRGSSMDEVLGNLHLEDDNVSDPGSHHSVISRGTVGGQNWQPPAALTEPSLSTAPSTHRGVEEDLVEDYDKVERRNPHYSAVK